MAHLLSMNNYHRPKEEEEEMASAMSPLPPGSRRPRQRSPPPPMMMMMGNEQEQPRSRSNAGPSSATRLENFTRSLPQRTKSSQDTSRNYRMESMTSKMSRVSEDGSSSSASQRPAVSSPPPRAKSSMSALQSMSASAARRRPAQRNSLSRRQPESDASDDARGLPGRSKSSSLAMMRTAPSARSRDGGRRSPQEADAQPPATRNAPRRQLKKQQTTTTPSSEEGASDLTSMFQQAIQMEQSGGKFEAVIQSARRTPVARTKSDSVAVLANASRQRHMQRTNRSVLPARTHMSDKRAKSDVRALPQHDKQPKQDLLQAARQRRQNFVQDDVVLDSDSDDSDVSSSDEEEVVQIRKHSNRSGNHQGSGGNRQRYGSNHQGYGRSHNNKHQRQNKAMPDSDSDDSDDEYDQFDDVADLPERPKMEKTLSFSSVFSDPLMDDEVNYTQSKRSVILTRKESVTARSLRSSTSNHTRQTISTAQTTSLLWIFCQLESSDEVITLYDVPSTCTFQEVLDLLWEKLVTSSSLIQQRPSLVRQRTCPADISLLLDSAEAAWCNATVKIPLPLKQNCHKTIERLLQIHYLGIKEDATTSKKKGKASQQMALPDIVTLHMDL